MACPPPATHHSVTEVFGAFLKLGLTSFGGPVAHLGFFRDEFVRRRKWLSDEIYADLVALCQFLPGPASSQTGFAIGYMRAGLPGAFAAWIAFTLPSAALMTALAYGVGFVPGGAGWLHGLKIAAVAVVAQAVWIMAARLCPDFARRALALTAAAAAWALPVAWMQVAIIAAGLAFGTLVLRIPSALPAHELSAPGRRLSAACLLAFFGLLAAAPLLVSSGNRWLEMAGGFYRSGALVFGGGHVVLPLLRADTSAWISRNDFLSGYGAAQAAPGPLFSFAAYLGALGTSPPWLGGLVGLLAIFLPSILLVLGSLRHWQKLRSNPRAQDALAGANAAVVGLLLAALVHPVGASAITSATSAVLAIAAFLALQFLRLPPWLLVLLCAAAGGLLPVN